MVPDNPPRWWSWSSFRPLFRGIGQRLLLVAPVALILLIAGEVIGDNLGVPRLFWHQDWPKQALAGFGVALLFAEVCLTGYLLDAGKPWLVGLPEDALEGWHRVFSRLADAMCRLLVPQPPGGDPMKVQQWRQLRWYVSTTWLPLLAILIVLAVLKAPERWGFLVGFVAALVIAGFFVWTFQHLDAAGLNDRTQRFIAQLPRPAITCTILVITFFLLLLVAAMVPSARVPVILLLGLWIGAAGAYAGAVRYEDAPPEQRWVHGLGAASFGLFFVAYHTLLLICLFSPVSAAQLVPPAVVLCLLLALIVACHGFLKFHFGGWYTAIALLVVAIAVGIAGFTGYRHQLEGFDYHGVLFNLEVADLQIETEGGGDNQDRRLARLRDSYDRLHKRYDALQPLVDSGRKEPLHRKDLKSLEDAQTAQHDLRQAMTMLEEKRLLRWKTALSQDKASKPKLAVVTVSGGGNRAAVWSAYTLSKLEHDLSAAGIHFPSHVRVITGASGGMLGASYFAATLAGSAGHGHKNDAEIEAFARKTGQDALTPISQRLLFFDLPGVFVPGGTTHDRGAALEEAWRTYLDGTLDQSFKQLAQGEAEGWRPSLILSPMVVEDGRRVLFSNLYLGPLTETTGSFLTADDAPTGLAGKQPQRPKGRFTDWPRYSLTAMEFFQIFPDSWPTFKLGTAVRLNAAFPYVSPIAALPTNPPRHLVDASYYDNFGVNLAAWWIYDNHKWLKEHTSGVVVIQIRDAATERKRFSPATDPKDHKSWNLGQGLEGIAGPLIGASNAFQSTMSFRNDEQLQALHDIFNTNPKAATPFFTTQVFECYGDIALSWYLSDQEIKDAMRGFEPGQANDVALGKLREWFKR